MKNLATYIIIGIVTIGLTLWQIQRGMQKLPQQIEPTTHQTTINIGPHHHLDRVSVQGHYIKNHIFVQPRTNENHQLGHQVWVPFKTDHQTIIVSLGFQQDISIPIASNISGTIFYLSKPPLRLMHEQQQSSSPHLVGQLDLDYFSSLMKDSLAPYIILIDGASEQNIAIPNIDRALRHFSYAVQFFLIGVILCYYVYRIRMNK